MKQDLLLHLLIGFLIGTVVNMFVIHFGNSHLIWIGAIATMIIGAVKELITKGTWDNFMLVAIGGSYAMFVDFIKLV
jgi:hypothetical protein